MNDFLFIVLGFFDVMAILCLIFKLFRFPFWDYVRDFALIGITLSIVSYVMRMILDIPQFDMGIQFVLYVLFFRYLIKFKLFDALLLVSMGYLSFDLLQLVIFKTLLAANIVSLNDAFALTGLGTYVIQLSSQFISFFIGWFMYRFHFGFSFVMQPPQEVSMKVKIAGANAIIFIAVLLTSAIVSSALYWLFNYHNEIHFVALAMLLVLSLLMYMARRKELSDL